MSEKKLFSIQDFNIVEKSETPFDFEPLNADGDPTGIILSVIGEHSEKVKEFTRKYFNRQRQQEHLAKKRGKEIVKLIEDDEEFGIDYVAIRLVDWKNISEPCTFENARIFLTINPEIRKQVVEVSETASNFTKSKSKI